MKNKKNIIKNISELQGELRSKRGCPEVKVALVHDYLREYGGAERVVEALHEIFPNAPLYVAFVDSAVTGIHWKKFSSWKIYQSWLTKIPFYKKLFSPLRIFAPQYFSKFDLSDYDLVISSTNAYFSKAVGVGDRKRNNGKKLTLHISYCHTPARSLYGYSTMTNWKKNPITHFLGTVANHYLRVVDFYVAKNNVDYFIANSKETARRIKKYYRLDSTVIYPPIEIKNDRKFIEAPVSKKSAIHKKQKAGYYLYVGRLAISKHVDLAIKSAKKMKFALKVVGSGKGLEYLKSIAGPTVEFMGGVSDKKLYDLYENATALLYPAEDEDFGMVPIEAMGHGVPIVAHKSGGPLETIIEGENGFFFNEFTVEDFGKAIKKIEKTKFDKNKIYKYSLKFSKERFKEEVRDFITSKILKSIS
ncbi:glycosyltransferase [Patescibacteria group bacterium]|nr:glycosyltransferase [Patescibacteria group bacterium]